MGMQLNTGDTGRAVSAAADGSLYSKVFGSGCYVLAGGNELEAEIQSNNLIKIYDGDLIMQGRHSYIPTSDSDNVTINNGSQGMNRKDLIVARYTKDSTGVEDVTLHVVQGTPTDGTAAAPEYTDGNILQGATTKDFPLYEVLLTGINITEVKKLFKVLGSSAEMSERLSEFAGIKYKRYTVTKDFVKGTNDAITIDIPWDKIVSIQGTLRYGANLHALPTSPVGGSGTYNEGMLAQLVITSSNVIQLWVTTAWNSTTLSVVVGYTD